MNDLPPEPEPGAEAAPVPADHPDRLRWNAKYEGGAAPSFRPHPLAVRALSEPPPRGPVLDLACGPSGGALLAASEGRRVTAVDVSETALGLLGEEARRRGLGELITLVHADLAAWTPPPRSFALVLCTGFWDARVFGPAADAVLPGGLLAWEAFTLDARRVRPGLPAEWCLPAGAPASLLGGAFTVLDQRDVPDTRHGTKRRMLARRDAGG
ncbi:class I SAM-dependent methyltransferase [Actinomadura viridis]|uniref:SAM-dependent methyltransferase n=1 Tax=Actinomadura viridis TaxID=58110 RepID=A0A931DG26_9ACTN|nr:class I SAM-dependent methyltransferase [Actinomadura viridis]MBG6090479.1 SAM-dependent methyltransferase [Actinomadura viridis]